MKIDNPFESGHIKNYILLYASVVVIMILFFFASSLFQERKEKIEKKNFNINNTALEKLQKVNKNSIVKEEKKFQLLDKAY